MRPNKLRLLVALLAATAFLGGCTRAIEGQPVAAQADGTTEPESPEGPTAGPRNPADLADRIRKTEACSLLDRTAAEKFGPFHGFAATGLDKCALYTRIEGSPNAFFLFELDLGASYYPEDRAKDAPHQVAGRQVYLNNELNDDPRFNDACYINIPIDRTEHKHQLRVRRVPPKGQKEPWPERCNAAKEYLAAIINNVIELPPHDSGPGPRGRTLMHQDPCAARKEIVTAFTGWKEEDAVLGAYSCTLTLRKKGDPYEIKVMSTFWRNNEQRPAHNGYSHSLAGLNGTQNPTMAPELNNAVNGCGDIFTYVPADPPGSANADLIKVDVTARPLQYTLSWPSLPFDFCAKADEVATLVINRIR
ncbi:hypothetical protein [Nocardia cyriacigeorgica]|uniref:hypothetical protein n=1 Tax=Nocardia cyriacigeorgica TaxID=135487 RepID=UPI0024571CB3|nr:hypothetical protein [Nocardia cyriacigeorgica]